MDFYYQGLLRWSYGFENPNKAAALIASLLPFCLLAFNAETRRARSWWLWGTGLLLLLGGWWLLIKTYSRGGVVAAAVSQGYVLWCLRTVIYRHWRQVMLGGLLMVAALTVMFIVSGLGARHVESVGDASVQNRLALWRGGLAMLADAPLGVGAGKSGQFYMDWYQPLTATAGYRTMVNSFLTFATEQGLMMLGLCLAGLLVFWKITTHHFQPRIDTDEHRLMKTAAAGSLLAFLVAGFFSTTMESWVLWLPPSAAVALLATVFWRSEKNWPLLVRRALVGGAAALTMTGLLYGAGCWERSRDGVRRSFDFRNGELAAVHLRGQQSLTMGHVTLWADAEVLGAAHGKEMRQILARGLAAELTVYEDTDDGATTLKHPVGCAATPLREGNVDMRIYCGRQCVLTATGDGQRVVFIMPSSAVAGQLAATPPPPGLRVVTSSRVAARDLAAWPADGRVLALGGAEKNAQWYWDEILDWLTADGRQ
ncbi:MAG: O-antigen ligase family protein [Verrucomicrobiales bacterium]|jgi:hypothetical protein|nr:O-antigen ligase family protein [Verrucomicrobiales bacterium]